MQAKGIRPVLHSSRDDNVSSGPPHCAGHDVRASRDDCGVHSIRIICLRIILPTRAGAPTGASIVGANLTKLGIVEMDAQVPSGQLEHLLMKANSFA